MNDKRNASEAMSLDTEYLMYRLVRLIQYGALQHKPSLYCYAVFFPNQYTRYTMAIQIVHDRKKE